MRTNRLLKSIALMFLSVSASIATVAQTICNDADATADASSTSSYTTAQVTEALSLTQPLDFHITSTTPFTETGSIDIVNTDKAVVIIDNLRPSLAEEYLGHITINGVAAKNGTNCQVRIYANGAMILPYTDKNVLTVFSELGLKGDSTSNFGTGNTGGFMNTLTAAQLNNRIKSFRLKRGYMVTFALKSGGYGYSRCFVAAEEDLEVDLPKLMQNRISSYRLFHWNNISKKGLANNTTSSVNDSLNTQWCYAFGLGQSMGDDRECVPHHIHENWPSIASVGAVTYSPMAKTNNEPANSSDDEPATVDQVLANWETLMATGMRLCSPSQHDGGTSWTKAFMDSIDARGWRCDVVDIHCYWPESSLLSGVESYYSTYKRPIWVSEWLWGASWNSNGVFAASNPDSDNATVLSKVLSKWNSSKYIERYAYWNSESKGKLYDNGVTASGKVYRDTKAPVGFNADIQYVPKAPRLNKPTDFTLTYTPSAKCVTLKWTDTNGDLNDSIFIERKAASGAWERIATVNVQDEKDAYTYKDTIPSETAYTYRIHCITYTNSNLYSSEQQVFVSNTQLLGDGAIQYGTLNVNNTDLATIHFSQPYASEEPAVIMGSVSNYQSNAALLGRVYKTNDENDIYDYTRLCISAWTDYAQTDFYSLRNGTLVSDFAPYLIAKNGTGTLGSLSYESQVIGTKKVGDTISITFATPFSSAPVVFVTPKHTSNGAPVTARVFDITNTGCKMKLMCQSSVTSSRYTTSGLFAIEQGTTTVGDKQITVVAEEHTFTNTGMNKLKDFDQTYHKPTFFVQLQSTSRAGTALLRTRHTIVDSVALRLRYQPDTSDATNATVSTAKPVTETIGYMIISDADTSNGIETVETEAIATKRDGIYDLMGRRIKSRRSDLPTGIYIKNGLKIVIK